MSRIAMISYYLPSGSKIGVGYQAHALANSLVARGHSVTMFSPCPPCPGASYDSVHVPLPDKLRSFAFAFAVRKLDLSGFDVLHAHGDDYWLWRRRVPVHIRTMHGSCLAEAVRIPRLREKVRMIALGLSELLATFVADRTVLVSPQTRRWMPWVKAVIPNGIDEQIFAPGEADRAAVPTIVFVGTYRNRKRGQLLMDVFRDEVRAAVPAARLIMVCEDAPPAEGVTVTGRITDSELAGLYRYAWVFCLPSSYEGFGIPYAEALSSGTPVVATENPGARFVLNEGRYGYLVTEKQLGSQLIAILSDPDVREEAMAMAAAGSGKYRMTEVIQKYEELYGG